MNLASGLLSWWNCNDASGGAADALSNAALSESLLGGSITYSLSGQVGTAIRCQDKAQLQNLGTRFYASSSWTLGGFFRIAAQFGSSHTCSLLRLGDSAPCLRGDFTNGSSYVVGLAKGGSSSFEVSHSLSSLSAFTHIAIRSDAGIITLWINGSSVASGSWSDWQSSGGVFLLGHHQTAGVAATGLRLEADNAFVYDRALSSDEINALADGADFPFAGIKAHQLTASVGYGTNSTAQLAGLRAHQLAASVGYATEASAVLAGVRAHQLAASAGYSTESTDQLAGLRVHQLAISVGYTTEPLGMHAPTAAATVEIDSVSSGTTAPTATATVETAAATPPLTLVSAPAIVSVAAATPPHTLAAATATVGLDATHFGTRAQTATATVATSSATPPNTVATSSATVETSNATPPNTVSPATATIGLNAVVSPLTVPTATAVVGVDSAAGLWFFVFPTLVKSQLGTPTVFKQETHNRLTATLKNEHGERLEESDFDLLLATIRSVKPVGFLRKPVNASGLIELSSGSFSWLLLPRDTRLLDDARASGNESHVALIEFLHAAERLDALTDPFSVTNGSPTLTVAHATHGLAVGDAVAFDAATEVGGISLAGLYVVASVPNANSYTALLHATPTATATGGGSVTAFIRPISNKWEINHSVAKADFM